MKIQKLKITLIGLLLVPTIGWGDTHQVVEINVNGMTCPFCVYGLSKNLGKVAGVAKADASLEQKKVRIVLTPDKQPEIDLYKKIIIDAGFTPGEAQIHTEQ